MKIIVRHHCNNLFQKSSKKEASRSKPPAKRKPKTLDVEGSEKRKPKKKKTKDPNAPKRAIAPFMYFSKAERAVSFLKTRNSEGYTADKLKKLGEKSFFLFTKP